MDELMGYIKGCLMRFLHKVRIFVRDEKPKNYLLQVYINT